MNAKRPGPIRDRARPFGGFQEGGVTAQAVATDVIWTVVWY